MEEQFNTMKLNPIVGTGNEAHDILMYVYGALQAKGYDPITQLTGCRLERDEIVEELVRSYMDSH